MVTRVLVANRGEIAVRVIRACHQIGAAAVVVHSEPDAGSMAVELADDAVGLSGATPAETYLDIDRVVDAARSSGCDAVHPGYGFLAENATFAAAVVAAGITWIGPSAEVIALMGDKLAARRTAEDAGVPIVPGVTVASDDADAVAALGDELGWPIAVKAVHGGGGRGMRVIERRGDVHDAIDSARRESQAAFGRPDVYVERYLARPRHVEVQVVADHHGGLVVVGDRDCSIQRRYQKLVEEAPAPSLPESVRAALARASIQLVRAVGYTNAGTIEFLVEDDSVYFLEMNTRIQVEHPVTELVTGVDLVVEQLRIAGGEPLSFGASDVAPRGHAIEVRINAEDTTGGRFIPTPGVLDRFDLPSGPRVRVDTGFRTGDVVAPFYDNLLAKVAVWGADREQARLAMLQALDELRVTGVPTTAPAARAILEHPDFIAVRHSTRWLTDHGADLLAAPIAGGDDDSEPHEDRPALEPDVPPREVEVLGRRYRIPRFTDDRPDADADRGEPVPGGSGGPARHAAGPARSRTAGNGRVVAPMQGTVRSVDVAVGDEVTAHTRVAVLEAMKMENNLLAGIDGVVHAVHVGAGDNVAPGTLLVEVTAASSDADRASHPVEVTR